jgi:hypothetical protein
MDLRVDLTDPAAHELHRLAQGLPLDVSQRLSNALGKHEDFAREWHSGDRQTIVVHGDCLCVLGVDGAPEPSR